MQTNHKCNLFSIILYYLTEKHFEQAIEYYTKAIEVNPSIAVYYGNRSIAHLKMESYGYALADASKALELDKMYLKVYYIVGVCVCLSVCVCILCVSMWDVFSQPVLVIAKIDFAIVVQLYILHVAIHLLFT